MANTKALTVRTPSCALLLLKTRKGYKAIPKYFQVLESAVQSIIKNYKEVHTVKFFKVQDRKPKVTPALARLVVREANEDSKDHHQGHPDKSEQFQYQQLKIDIAAQGWSPWTPIKEDSTSPRRANKCSSCLWKAHPDKEESFWSSVLWLDETKMGVV